MKAGKTTQNPEETSIENLINKFTSSQAGHECQQEY